jgi:nicotinate-nucleotide adenylyltransferase
MRTLAGVERLGIFGGTFDPVHVGHLVAAMEAREQLHLDRTVFSVAGDPWQKHGTVVAPADARLAMVRAAVEGIEGFEVTSIEIDRAGPSYTIDTVEAYARAGRELFLVVGADAALRLDTWARVDDLRTQCTLAVVTRAGDGAELPPSLREWPMVTVSMPRLDISSSELRARVGRGQPIDFFVPPAAVRVIRDRRLYTPT